MNFSSSIARLLRKFFDDKSKNKFQHKLNLKYLFVFLLFGTLGYLGNYCRLPLFFGVDFLFGSIFIRIVFVLNMNEDYISIWYCIRLVTFTVATLHVTVDIEWWQWRWNVSLIEMEQKLFRIHCNEPKFVSYCLNHSLLFRVLVCVYGFHGQGQ